MMQPVRTLINAQFYRRILKFLIPVKLSIGVLPRITLLERYNLLEVYILVHLLNLEGNCKLRLAVSFSITKQMY